MSKKQTQTGLFRIDVQFRNTEGEIESRRYHVAGMSDHAVFKVVRREIGEAAVEYTAVEASRVKGVDYILVG